MARSGVWEIRCPMEVWQCSPLPSAAAQFQTTEPEQPRDRIANNTMQHNQTVPSDHDKTLSDETEAN